MPVSTRYATSLIEDTTAVTETVGPATKSRAFAQASPVAYRPDIDGLRAVAVLLVVFDHLHTRIRGGYIGVDVFFVISGYLISATILKEMGAGAFSIRNFYERRIRRIFPALLVMLLLVSVLAVHFLVPSEIESYARSLVGALFSASNFVFWHQAGYFDTPSQLKPLLHTWSLAVEEQFYILFPLFLLAVRRWFPPRLRFALWAVAGLSFVLASVWVHRDAATAFFWAPLRAWELLAGTLLSQRYLPTVRSATARNLASLAGIALIIVPALVYTARTTFPGIAALPPCLGAVLLIAAGEYGSSCVSRLLSWKPVVFLGLISYSLYLWHWPILVFQNEGYLLVDAQPGSKTVKVTVFLVSVVVATLSWALVETPFRKGKFRPGQRTLLWINGLAFAATLLVGVRMLQTRGFASGFPPQAIAADSYTHYDPKPHYREGVCFLNAENTFLDFRPSVCLPASSPSAPRPRLLLLGDSHAAHLYPGLATVYPDLQILQANTASCRPFLSQLSRSGACADLYRYIYGDYLLHNRPDVVLLAGRWDESDFPQLAETVHWLQQHGQKVILFGPIMEFTEPLPRLLALALRDGRPAEVNSHWDAGPAQTDLRLAELARETWHIQYISAFNDLCSAQVEMVAKAQPETASGCPLYAAPGVPLLFDTDHFTAEGSILYARAMRVRNQLP